MGKGGFGSVYKVGNTAVKRITSADDGAESFIREALVAASLDHPNVVKCNAVSVDNWTLSMDLYDYTLHKYARRHKISPKEATQIAKQLVAGLAYIHRRGFIHADLKPDNVLIKLLPFTVAIADFGLATPVRAEYLPASIQTRSYRAPEVDVTLPSGCYGAGIDMWSLGCILFELLVGVKFNRGHAADSTIGICRVFRRMCKSRAARIGALYRMTHEDVLYEVKLYISARRFRAFENTGYVALLTRCLVPNPEWRITSMEALHLFGDTLNIPRAPIAQSYRRARRFIEKTIARYVASPRDDHHPDCGASPNSVTITTAVIVNVLFNSVMLNIVGRPRIKNSCWALPVVVDALQKTIKSQAQTRSYNRRRGRRPTH